jgi:hypothetical protein
MSEVRLATFKKAQSVTAWKWLIFRAQTECFSGFEIYVIPEQVRTRPESGHRSGLSRLSGTSTLFAAMFDAAEAPDVPEAGLPVTAFCAECGELFDRVCPRNCEHYRSLEGIGLWYSVPHRALPPATLASSYLDEISFGGLPASPQVDVDGVTLKIDIKGYGYGRIRRDRFALQLSLKS